MNDTGGVEVVGHATTAKGGDECQRSGALPRRPWEDGQDHFIEMMGMMTRVR